MSRYLLPLLGSPAAFKYVADTRKLGGVHQLEVLVSWSVVEYSGVGDVKSLTGKLSPQTLRICAGEGKRLVETGKHFRHWWMFRVQTLEVLV